MRTWLALAVLLMLTACGGGGGTNPSASAGKDQITIGIAQLSTTWQEQLTGDWHTSQVWNQLVDTLVFLDTEGKVHPYLAKSWDISKDGLVYTFHLREGVTFSDGTPLTGDVVAKNLNLIARGDPARGIQAFSFLFPSRNYKESVAVDDHTVNLVLNEPSPGLLKVLGDQRTGILSLNTINLPLDQQNQLKNVHGSGPYVLDSEVAGQRVTLVRRDDYNWAFDGAKHPKAQIGKLIFTVLTDNNVREGSLTSGQTDLIQYVPPTDETDLEDKGYNLIRTKYFGAAYALQLRVTAKGTSEKNVRLAIQHGIDRDQILKTLYNEHWEPATGVYNSNVAGNVDISKKFAFDPTLANRLLDEAGWTGRDSAGIRTKNGEALSLFAYPSVYITTSKPELELIGQQLAAIGIKLDVRSTNFSTYGQQTATDDLPIYEIHWDLQEAGRVENWWSKDTMNVFRANDPQLESLLHDSASTLDDGKRAEALANLQNYVVDQGYLIPLHQIYMTFGANPRLADVITTGIGRLVLSQASVSGS